jgi:hypothetical protein
VTVETNIDKGLTDAIKKQRVTNSKPSAKKAKVSTKTNFDNTYADIIFPFVFDVNSKGVVDVNTGGLAKASKTSSIKVKVLTVKAGGIDSTAGLILQADGTPKGEHTGFGTVKPVKVTFGSALVIRKKSGKTAKGQSAKTYKKVWLTLSVPKSATATDVIAWIQKNWKKKPNQLQIGERVYNIKPAKAVYNNPTIAQTAASAAR